ncbi:hypothetical protein GALL_216270 [mine drainage metagenome]|uniref:Uncharacterized protein n=1 Tax=mine drainage metagenome TaxID=410659 RepID=A0A1J5RJW5_9ZZZZ
MDLMNVDDFLFGRAQPMQPSQPIISDLIVNGVPMKEIKEFLETGIANENCRPLQIYSDARGYKYEWGHIIEKVSFLVEDGEISHYASWDFCLDGLLSKFHRKGLRLHDLSVLCQDILCDEKRRPCIYWQIPNFMHVFHGNKVSTFKMVACGVGTKGLEEIDTAREWIACCFLDLILEKVIKIATKSLSRHT